MKWNDVETAQISTRSPEIRASGFFDHSSFVIRHYSLLSFAGLLATLAPAFAAEPIKLHPDNPHYFLWRGQPTILITSAEHYGAVLNLDFDYAKYLDTLAADKLNLTRTFTGGAYVEPQGAFNIARNTLAPAPGRFICPWARSDEPGYANGGNKFDLDRWDEAYFKRLRESTAHASRRGIVVEMNLFCPFYEETQWKLSPFNAANNVNGLGHVGRTNVYTLDRHGGLLAVQEKMVRRIVAELREFDNVYYEICNEPYFGGVTMAWQHHMADVILEAQKLGRSSAQAGSAVQLISQNIANNTARIEKPHPAISVFNFHYAAPPDAVAMNFQLNKVIGDNETGFRGTNDAPYRMEAWDFILAGGGLYNNLDYSFTVGHEDGTFVYPANQPGGGNPTFRKQMRALRDFIYSFDFVRMHPDNSVIKGGVPPGLTARALVEPGKAYALYLRPSLTTQFSARWTGQVEPKFSEEYTFYTISNDGARLWINGRQIINDWNEHGEQENAGKITLEAGRKYDVKLEYFYNGGSAAMKLLWASSSQAKQPVPSSQLWLPGGSGNGLKGEYFTGQDFERPWQTRDDPQVNFAWGSRSPFPVPAHAGEATLEIELPPGSYKAEWFDTKSGAVAKTEDLKHPGGIRKLASPTFAEDIALGVKAVSR
ncbi:MAG: hypothetical protein HYY23_04780 [Verrucomicrobia bacterium]|nr:hypothetical protein [Verrucomicrobiota bacterium]